VGVRVANCTNVGSCGRGFTGWTSTMVRGRRGHERIKGVAWLLVTTRTACINAIGGDVSNDDGCCNGGFDSLREFGYPRNTAFAGAIRRFRSTRRDATLAPRGPKEAGLFAFRHRSVPTAFTVMTATACPGTGGVIIIARRLRITR